MRKIIIGENLHTSGVGAAYAPGCDQAAHGYSWIFRQFDRTPMQVDQVFGISPEVREHSYVDRGNLDEEMIRMLRRTTHIAVRGPSKSGKSWLRQKGP